MEEMIQALARLVKYNSVEGEALPGKPFGEAPAACLAEALQIAEEMGFETKNMENYCGYAEMGSGKDIIGIVGHLDVVPAGEGWETDPFTVVRKGDVIYGRGVNDDKGAVIASMFAMKAVKDMGIPMNKRVRLLMGCNEETGSACMQYYAEHGEPITTGFTPDGYFPGIFGEKGGMKLNFYSKHTNIISMNGGFVSNAVCNHCVTVVPADAVDVQKLKDCFAADHIEAVVTEENGAITMDVQGVAAHASTPELGVNAAAFTMKALQDAGMKDDFVEFYMSHFGTTCDGVGIGAKVSDEYGALTLNNGIVKTADGVISGTIDIRYPVTLNPEKMRALVAPYLEDENGRIEIDHIGEPLFYPEDSELVKKLHEAYVEVIGDTKTQPMVIGGGTYAKSVPGIIAFGCEFPGEDNHIHDANESMKLEQFAQQVEIYKKAILKLLEA